MTKTWRNRALLPIGLFVIALAIFGIWHYAPILLKTEQDPIAMIEENGAVDVIYYGIGEHESDLLGQTPTAALGIIYHAPGIRETDARYHVRLTDNGWEIVRGRYDWSPDMEESYSDSIHLWNFEKLHWWKENGMFCPGQYNRTYEAVYGLLDWYQGMVFRDFLYRVFVWAENSGVRWNALEIDLVGLNGPAVLPGYTTESGPGYVVGWWPSLNSTLVMFKYRRETVFIPEGRWAEIKRNPVQEALEVGELTEEALNALVESKQLQATGATTLFGARQYTKGFNHPWQAREMAQEGAT